MRNARLLKAAVSLSALLFLLCASGAFADQLGQVNFPTTCSSGVQPAIEKGLALLHSFQYKESEQTFTDAATREPKCAMAHWGKAMARYYQIWEFPNKKKLTEGRKDIERGQKISSTSSREKAAQFTLMSGLVRRGPL